MAELSQQKSVYGSASGKPKKGCSGFRLSTIFPYQYRHYNAKKGRKDKPGLNNVKKTETSTEQNSLYKCLFAILLVRNRRGDKGAFDSSGSPLIETAHDSIHR